MVRTHDFLSDLVRVEQGWWRKDSDGVWRFQLLEDRLSKGIKLREGEGVESVRSKVCNELNIDVSEEKAELTYEMPEWMDVDGTVKPVPIHIQTDDDMDMFLAMRVELHEMKLYVVPLPKNMSLEVDEYSVVLTMDEFSFAEVMSRQQMNREKERRTAKSIIDDIAVSQLPREMGESSRRVPIGWVGNALKIGGLGPVSAAFRVHNARCKIIEEREAASEVGESSSIPMSQKDIINLTKDLYKEFEATGNCQDESRTALQSPVASLAAAADVGTSEGSSSGSSPQKSGPHLVTDLNLPPVAFERDAAPVVDDIDNADGNQVEGWVMDVDYEGDELFIGRVFKSKEDCKVKIAVHAINRRFSYRNERSNNEQVIVRCVSPTCPWRVYCVRVDEGDYFQVRTANLVHTCPVDVRAQFHQRATTSVISNIIRNRYAGGGRGPSTPQVLQSLREEHNVNVSYWKAWRARELARDDAKGSAAGSFGLLPTYLHLLRQSNPGTLTELATELDQNGGNRFKYCFVSFGACITGIKFMRRVLVIDGAHLKGRYQGCLLTASAQDGNFQIFPLAFAIVDSENDKAWEWFFEKLSQIVPDSDDLTFVSDRHSSIYSGLAKVYPRATHGACIVHLTRNIVNRFKLKALAPMIARAARAYRRDVCQLHFSEIEKVSPLCAEYLTAIGMTHWTRSHCDGARYNIMTSNVAESLNAVLREARELPIVSTFEYIRSILTTWFQKRRDMAAKHIPPLTPMVSVIVQANYIRSTSYQVIKINDGNYEVKTPVGLSFHVDLHGRTCTCSEFTLLKIPCCHAIAAAVRADIRVDQLADITYTTLTWLLAYNGSINPVPDMTTIYNVPDEIATLKVLPPQTRRPPGRPKRCRYLSTGEIKRPRKLVKRTCSRCRGAGHNKASCKMPI